MSYDQTNARHVMLRLTEGQGSVLRGLDMEPSILGCAETIAIRLSKATKRRPALVTRVQHEGQPAFILNTMGLAVKSQLLALEAVL